MPGRRQPRARERPGSAYAVLEKVGTPGGPSVDEAIALLRRARGTADEALAVEKALENSADRNIPEPVRVACADVLAARGDEAAALFVGRVHDDGGARARVGSLRWVGAAPARGRYDRAGAGARSRGAGRRGSDTRGGPPRSATFAARSRGDESTIVAPERPAGPFRLLPARWRAAVRASSTRPRMSSSVERSRSRSTTDAAPIARRSSAKPASLRASPGPGSCGCLRRRSGGGLGRARVDPARVDPRSPPRRGPRAARAVRALGAATRARPRAGACGRLRPRRPEAGQRAAPSRRRRRARRFRDRARRRYAGRGREPRLCLARAPRRARVARPRRRVRVWSCARGRPASARVARDRRAGRRGGVSRALALRCLGPDAERPADAAELVRLA